MEKIVVKYLGSIEHRMSQTIINSIRKGRCYHIRNSTKVLCDMGPW
jgi:hypothetical protein